MPEKKKRAVKDLASEEIEYYYTLLSENVTAFDCGELCAPDHNGVPYCCIADHAVPLLYKSEFELLSGKGDLWFKWIAKTKEEKELKSTARRDQVFCECRGAEHCVRDQRSISCRTFPLEPYMDRRGVMVGLTFLEDFTRKDEETEKVKCPLTLKKHHKEIRQEFIDSSFAFWEKLLLRHEDEYELYIESSRLMRRSHEKNGYEIHVFYPTHYRNIKSMRDYIY